MFSRIVHVTVLLMALELVVFNLPITVDSALGADVALRVGIYQNPPKIFRDEAGQPQGFWPELTDEISRRQKWPIRYVTCEWKECLEMLQKGEIDVLPDVAYSAKRATLFPFGNEVVFRSWSQVFHRPDKTISGILDLSGLRIAMLSGSIQQERLTHRLKEFGVESRFVFAPSLAAALSAISEGSADAAVVNRFLGARLAPELGLVPSGIVIAPSAVHFAFAPGTSSRVIADFDDVVASLKSGDDSIYYKELAKLTDVSPQSSVPTFVYWVIGIGVGFICLAFGAVVILRRLVTKRTEELDKQRNILKAVFENAPVELYLKDIEGRYLQVNRRFEELYNVRNKDLIGKLPQDIHGLELAERTRIHDRKVLETGEVDISEENTLTEFGARVLHTVKFPVFDDQGNIVGLGAVVSDVTDLKTAETDLLAALAKAEKANRSKSEFLATMSHEFRTPLNAILGFSEMMRAQYFGPLGAENYEEYANDIHDSGQHMLALIDDILDISAIEAGKRVMVKEAIDVGKLLRECIRNVEQVAREKGVDLSMEFPEETPSLYADRRSVVQIALNLLSNAIKFTDRDGKVSISILLSGQEFTMKVSDTGIGISPDRLPKITEPFSQAHDDPHITQNGTGLGLSIVRSLVEAQDAKLCIDSELGKGTTVAVIFPQ